MLFKRAKDVCCTQGDLQEDTAEVPNEDLDAAQQHVDTTQQKEVSQAATVEPEVKGKRKLDSREAPSIPPAGAPSKRRLK